MKYLFSSIALCALNIGLYFFLFPDLGNRHVEVWTSLDPPLKAAVKIRYLDWDQDFDRAGAWYGYEEKTEIVSRYKNSNGYLDQLEKHLENGGTTDDFFFRDNTKRVSVRGKGYPLAGMKHVKLVRRYYYGNAFDRNYELTLAAMVFVVISPALLYAGVLRKKRGL